MKKVFLITDDDELDQHLHHCATALEAEVVTSAQWSEAKDALFKERYDAVCIDYDAIKIEGLDAFILLDNVLQKEQTPAVLILRKASQRAKQFISSLDSFRDSIELEGADPTVELLQPHLEALLDEPLAAEDPVAAAEAAEEPVVVEVHLPSLDNGSLATVNLARVLYTLAQTGVSGALSLDNGSIHRRYAFSDGQPLVKPGASFGELDTLASAFAWQDGSYAFEPGHVDDAPTEEWTSFVFRAIERHMPQRRVMQAMMPHMRAYPTPTHLGAKRHDAIKDEQVLDRFLAACDGATTLEKALASLGAQATAGFKASLFAHLTDLIMLRGQPTPQGVTVQYDEEVKQLQQQRVEEQKKTSKAYRATGTGRLDLERELREFLSEVEQATPYEIFDVWEGCGSQPIQTKFYEMVKSHHPDVYGGNVSGDVKRLAQEIFIAIKDAYTELLKVEREQTRPDPRPPSAAQASSEVMTPSRATTNTSADSDISTERLRARRQARGTAVPSGIDELSFGAEQAASVAHEPPVDAAARKSRVERLKAKRSSTPIGLSREPSTPIVEGKSRRSPIRNSTKERRAKLDKIRRNSTTSGTTGSINSVDAAKRAFNEGYKAYRENENIALAYDRFSTAYNLEPDNGKYMTFYGYLLFLHDADKRDEAQKVLEKAIEIGDRQSLPDAHVFLGHILKVQDKTNEAVRHFQTALKLNPKSREAQREMRLYKKRHHDQKDGGDGPSFLKNLFKK